MAGMVSFVGSGPGDPELLTIRAVNRLRRAEAVLYDDLSAGPILSYAGSGADLVSVGKRAGHPSPKQSHVSRLLVTYAGKDKRVVRLKSGDGGLFGRLEEEIVALRNAGISYEIVPGVPSACAAAAAAGIPLTRRLSARRVQFVTGHDVTGALPADLDLSALADPLAVTAVFMGKRTFPELADLLLDHGLPDSTPALIAESVSRPEQRVARLTIGSLSHRLTKQAHDTDPAVILYGSLLDE